jgi:hypothetical protein
MLACSYSGLTLAKYVVVILTGLITGLVCVVLDKSVAALIHFRNRTMATMLQENESLLPAFGFNMAYGLSLTTMAACMVRLC